MTRRHRTHDTEHSEATEPLLDAEQSTGHRVLDIDPDREPGGGGASDVGSPPHHHTPHAPHSIRILRRASAQEPVQPPPEEAFTLALKAPEGDGDDREDNVREVEVELLTEAVAEAVADAVNEVVQEAVHEAVNEAVHDAVVQAIEENVNFDVRANIYTLVAVTGVVLFWRGVWNTWDYLFGLGLWSELACIATGLSIMMLIRLTNVPLAQGLPGG